MFAGSSWLNMEKFEMAEECPAKNIILWLAVTHLNIEYLYYCYEITDVLVRFCD